MFFCLAFLSFSKIEFMTPAQFKEAKLSGYTVLLVDDSSKLLYPSHLDSFMQTSREVVVDGRYIVCDMYNMDENLADIGIEEFPSVWFFEDDLKRGGIKTLINEENIINLVNENAISHVSTISSSEELEDFAAYSAFGLVAAFENASSTTLPAIEELFRLHYNEINIVYASPSLFDAPGFYLYSFTEQEFKNIPISFDMSIENVMETITEHSTPSIFKYDTFVHSFLMNDNATFAIFQSDLKGFYAGKEFTQVSRHLSEKCQMNITFADSSLDDLSSVAFGFPKGKEFFAIVDSDHDTPIKYLTDKYETVDDLAEFCEDVANGKAKKFLKSAMHKETKGAVQEFNAYEIVETQKDYLVVGLYYEDDGCLHAFKQYAEENADGKLKFGQFSVVKNDWSFDDVERKSLPRLLMFVNNEIIADVYCSQDANEIQTAILEGFGKYEDL